MDLSSCRQLLAWLLVVSLIVVVVWGLPQWVSDWLYGETFTEYQNQRAEQIVSRAGNVLKKKDASFSKFCDKMDGTCEAVEYHDARDLARAGNLTKEALAEKLPTASPH